MTYANSISNRARLVDYPIVELLLSLKYSDSDINFTRSSNETYYYSSGNMRRIVTNRNSSKYYNSSNFTLSLDKNNLNVFNNTSYVFIDETLNAMYIVDGVLLLKYIIEHTDNIKDYDNGSKSYVILPKKDIRSIISDNPNATIKYNNVIAKLFEDSRDENKFAHIA